MVGEGDIEDIIDDYQALSDLYDSVSQEPLTVEMREYLEMVRAAMDLAEGRMTREDMEGGRGSEGWDLRKTALIEYDKPRITYYTDSEGIRRQRITHEWPDWVPIEWEDSWEDWKNAGGY